MNKRGQVEGLQGLLLGIVAVAITLVVGFVVIAELKQSSTSADANTSIDTITTKLGLVPNFIGIIIVVALSAIVLAFLVVRGRR